MKYKFYTQESGAHYINIELFVDQVNAENLELQLPSWRPGRYELGNFARNIKKFEAFNDKGEKLEWKKINKDLWQVKTNNCSEIKITYAYYAAEINAGSCYVDNDHLYINPVNCCMYVPDRMKEEHCMELILPDNFNAVSSLEQKKKFTFNAPDFDVLADSPIIAAKEINTIEFEKLGLIFYLHFNGECKPDKEKLLKDFPRFCEEIIAFYGDCPVKEYHFLIQVLPYKFYHGVEHLSSTVIAIGPGHSLMHTETYLELLGVSCHELFHTWNIKSIRPIEMLPYDYTKENYARTGFVYEGITTYYGDKLLLTSGVFTKQDYFNTLEERLDKHFHNYGRFNLSVADSSFDNWLDGYVPGAPYRKVSIYDEGNLVAFMLDVMILRDTQNKKGLRDVMQMLYNDFYKKNKGYSENDINSLVHYVAEKSYDDFFNQYVYGTVEYEDVLLDCFNYLGLSIEKYFGNNVYEHFMGLKTIEQGQYKKITLVAPNSPAWHAGLTINDEIIGVEKRQLKNDFNQLLNYYLMNKNTVELTIVSNSIIKQISIQIDRNKHNFPFHKIVELEGATNNQKNNFLVWAKSNALN